MKLLKQPGDTFFIPRKIDEPTKDFLFCCVTSVTITENDVLYNLGYLDTNSCYGPVIPWEEKNLKVALESVSVLHTKNARNIRNVTSILDVPIGNLTVGPESCIAALPLRTVNCLRAEEIFTVRDLVFETEAEICKYPNIGRKAVEQIKEVLSSYGLNLGMSEDGL